MYLAPEFRNNPAHFPGSKFTGLNLAFVFR